jgi:NADH-quinone oxidoreductase subunit N
VLILSAILSFFVGSLGGVFQKRIKRLLAYSAVSNNGFFLLALLVGNVYGTTVLLFFLVVYVFTLIGTFSSLQVIVLESNQDFEVSNIWSWTSLVFVRKLLAISLVILLFSSAGIPPFVGFMTKFVLLFTSMSSTSA